MVKAAKQAGSWSRLGLTSSCSWVVYFGLKLFIAVASHKITSIVCQHKILPGFGVIKSNQMRLYCAWPRRPILFNKIELIHRV